jgi:acetyltransferase-like isoleucine patch superfamily enzyme
MWIFKKDINKTFAVKNNDFELVHTVIDGWINYHYQDHILFEYNGRWYIANDINNIYLGFNKSVTIGYGTRSNKNRVVKVDHDWVLYLGYHKKRQWKNSYGNYKLNLDTNIFVPHNVHPDYDASGNELEATRHGSDVYRSDTKFGKYTWIGAGWKDDIIVGWRKYTHKEIDDNGDPTDIDVIESQSLIEIRSNFWHYTYQNETYSYSGELPLENFIMISDSKTLEMTYSELTSLTKNILHYDGGAQIVD